MTQFHGLLRKLITFGIQKLWLWLMTICFRKSQPKHKTKHDSIEKHVC